MSKFLNEVIKGEKFELLIDTNVFSKDIILKASYNFLDIGYFFFRFDDNKNIILEFTKKQDIETDPKIIIGEFSDELLNVYLRDRLEKDNKIIREAIVKKALLGPIDKENFITLDTDKKQQDVIDFDKDIDEILKEIENDPELKIDEEEIANILKEIEQETTNEAQKPEVKASKTGISDAKELFKKKK